MQVARDQLTKIVSKAVVDAEERISSARHARKILLSEEYNSKIALIPELLLMNAWIDRYSPNNIYTYIMVPGFTYVDAPKLFEALESLEVGFGECVVKDDPQNSIREFRFELAPFTVTLCAHLTDDAVCQRVAVGSRRITKLVELEHEEPVYEFRC